MAKRAKRDTEEGDDVDRTQTTIDLTDVAAEQIRSFVAIYGGRGMKKQVLSKLVSWFADQPDWMKQVVLGWTPVGVKKTYADMLRVMAQRLEEEDERSGVVFSSDGLGAAILPTATASGGTGSSPTREPKGQESPAGRPGRGRH